jgi:hypothetical protein
MRAAATFLEQPPATSTAPIAHLRDPRLKYGKMSNPQEAWQRLQRMAMQSGRGGGPAPKGVAGGIGGLLLLGGVSFVGYNALFNVDGGHRAIKYTRIGGVSKEIYAEGIACSLV